MIRRKKERQRLLPHPSAACQLLRVGLRTCMHTCRHRTPAMSRCQDQNLVYIVYINRVSPAISRKPKNPPRIYCVLSKQYPLSAALSIHLTECVHALFLCSRYGMCELRVAEMARSLFCLCRKERDPVLFILSVEFSCPCCVACTNNLSLVSGETSLCETTAVCRCCCVFQDLMCVKIHCRLIPPQLWPRFPRRGVALARLSFEDEAESQLPA